VDTAPLLRATFFLDAAHPSLVALAAEVSRGASTQREQAVRLFRWVRDQVRYDPYSVRLRRDAFTASATLAARRGFCITKAILYAAGLRALGIPSRLGFADVINHLATERLRALMRTELFVYHGYAEALLDGRWVKATPAFDAALCERFGVAPLEFDGVHDAVLQPVNARGDRFMEYVRDRGATDDFSYEDFLAAWTQHYPHLVSSPLLGGGDFHAEASSERR